MKTKILIYKMTVVVFSSFKTAECKVGCHFVECVFGESAAERWGWSVPFCGCESRSPNRSWPRIRRTRSLCWAVARFRSMQLGWSQRGVPITVNGLCRSAFFLDVFQKMPKLLEKEKSNRFGFYFFWYRFWNCMRCTGKWVVQAVFFWHFYLLCIILLQVSPHRLNHLHFVNMFVEHDHVFSKFNWVGREIGEAKECFLEKMESMDLTMLTCLHTPPRFVLKRLEDPRIKNLKIDADLLEAWHGGLDLGRAPQLCFNRVKLVSILYEWSEVRTTNQSNAFQYEKLGPGVEKAWIRKRSMDVWFFQMDGWLSDLLILVFDGTHLSYEERVTCWMRRINSSNSSEKDVISLAFIALLYFAYWMYILFDS